MNLGNANPYVPIVIITNKDKLVKNDSYADSRYFTYSDANEWNGEVEGPVAEQKQSKKVEGVS